MSIYLNDWADSGEQQMLSDFNIAQNAIVGASIIVASYTYENYEGAAYVMFERDGLLWEVHGSHCSCFGLSKSDYYGNPNSQWQPEQTTREAIERRLDAGGWGYGGSEIADVIRSYFAAHGAA